MNVLKHGRSTLLLKLSIACGVVFATVQTQAVSHAAEKNASAKKTNKVLLGTPELTSGIPGKGPLTKKEIKEWLSQPENHEILEVTLPLGLSAGAAQMVGLKENPLTRAKVELGRQLYFDTRLSSDNTISCASCHHPDEGYGRHTQFGIGVRDQEGGRNSPISYNRILSGPQFWDGRAATLEEQAVGPIANPIEMANTHEAAVKTLKGIPGYQMQFKKIFKDGITIDNVGKAIAAFERTLVTGPSPFDYQEKLKPFLKMDKEDLEDLEDVYQPILAQTKKHPMSKSALRGMDLFFSEKVNCAACHVGPNMTDEKYHNLGVGMDAKKPDLGRYEVTKQEKDKGAFKTPTIRNVEFSAPYMHDGSQKTLEEVVEHYNKGGTPNPYLSEKVKKLNLSDQDKKDLVAFMKACSGPFPKVETGRLPQ
ncbi:Cytochrome c551 peroxidase precursor [Gimesia alba]|uniref:Cytochrome c551 peroxidase n=1 Tax=Gimesia alba TaxID=2527973 RepID=A0A517RCE0_9PLAN|nr:cytochrome c peroxidase [Gimesia alba]QDT41561.1 Cytochrome c551 peroxidase precursor [Gimesia alba]